MVAKRPSEQGPLSTSLLAGLSTSLLAEQRGGAVLRGSYACLRRAPPLTLPDLSQVRRRVVCGGVGVWVRLGYGGMG